MINTDAEGDSEQVKEDWFFLITVPVVSAYNTAELQESWISYPDEPFHLGKQGKLRAEGAYQGKEFLQSTQMTLMT